MPKWLKVVLMIMGVGGFFAVLGVGGVVLWVQQNKDRIVAEGKESKDNGAVFGRGNDKNSCVDEGLKRTADCGTADFMCEARQKIFVVSCLGTAHNDPSFCQGVPKMGEIMATSTWLVGECDKRGLAGSQKCSRLLQAVPEHCAGRR